MVNNAGTIYPAELLHTKDEEITNNTSNELSISIL